jgi:hypothetical protein
MHYLRVTNNPPLQYIYILCEIHTRWTHLIGNDICTHFFAHIWIPHAQVSPKMEPEALMGRG